MGDVDNSSLGLSSGDINRERMFQVVGHEPDSQWQGVYRFIELLCELQGLLKQRPMAGAPQVQT